jgi:hypothetical protein
MMGGSFRNVSLDIESDESLLELRDHICPSPQILKRVGFAILQLNL